MYLKFSVVMKTEFQTSVNIIQGPGISFIVEDLKSRKISFNLLLLITESNNIIFL